MAFSIEPGANSTITINGVAWTVLTGCVPKVARKRRTTSRPDRCRPAVRARGLGHRPAWPATLEAGGGDRRQGVCSRPATRRPAPEGDHTRCPEPVRPAREPRLRPPGLPGAQPGRAVGRQAEAVPVHHDALKLTCPVGPT